MSKKQDEQTMKKTMNWVLGFSLIFLAVILGINAVRKVQETAVVSAVIGFCGLVLFGGVGISLLVGEIRQWLHKKT